MRSIQRHFILLTSLCLVAAACSTGSTRIQRTYEDRTYADRVYGNLLVIGVAADYNARSRFEQSLASALRSPTTKATGYFDIADGDHEVTREKIVAAIDEHGYDGVVVTRIGARESEVSVKTGSTGAKVSRREGNALDLFRYDYEILNEPHQVNLEMTLRLVTDFFDAADQKLIWTAESIANDKQNINYQLGETARKIAARLDNDGLVAN